MFFRYCQRFLPPKMSLRTLSGLSDFNKGPCSKIHVRNSKLLQQKVDALVTSGLGRLMVLLFFYETKININFHIKVISDFDFTLSRQFHRHAECDSTHGVFKYLNSDASFRKEVRYVPI